MDLCVWARRKIAVDCKGISTWAKSNKNCSRTKHFQANDRLFFRKNWTCSNHSIRTTQNSQFWVVYNHLFASCVPRNQENQSPKTDQSSPQQCELKQLHFWALKIDLMSHPTYSPDLVPTDFFLFPYLKNKMRGQCFSTPEEAVDAFSMHVLEIPQSVW